MITIKHRIDQTLEFRGAAEFLRWLEANRGHKFRSLKYMYLSDPERNGKYWFEKDAWLEISKEDYAHVYRVLKRYHSYYHHMTEIDPEWVDGKKTYWMDNSIDQEQHSAKYPGMVRTVQREYPHGDACF